MVSLFKRQQKEPLLFQQFFYAFDFHPNNIRYMDFLISFIVFMSD